MDGLSTGELGGCCDSETVQYAKLEKLANIQYGGPEGGLYPWYGGCNELGALKLDKSLTGQTEQTWRSSKKQRVCRLNGMLCLSGEV